MKDQSFNIKVGDLLRNLGSKDTIEFEGKFTPQLPNLSENGLSGTLLLQSLNKDSVLADLINVSCLLNDNCDICQKDFQREIKNDFYRVKFILPLDGDMVDDSGDEEIFPINPKDESINIEDMIVQSIVLQEPIVKYCNNCKDKHIDDDENDEDEDYFESASNIVFN